MLWLVCCQGRACVRLCHTEIAKQRGRRQKWGTVDHTWLYMIEGWKAEIEICEEPNNPGETIKGRQPKGIEPTRKHGQSWYKLNPWVKITLFGCYLGLLSNRINHGSPSTSGMIKQMHETTNQRRCLCQVLLALNTKKDSRFWRRSLWDALTFRSKSLPELWKSLQPTGPCDPCGSITCSSPRIKFMFISDAPGSRNDMAEPSC